MTYSLDTSILEGVLSISLDGLERKHFNNHYTVVFFTH